MQSMISELWNGNIAPCEHCGAHDQQANTLYARLQRCREALSGGLTVEKREAADQCAQLWEDYLLRMMELAFQEGFVIGSRMAAEVHSRV